MHTRNYPVKLSSPKHLRILTALPESLVFGLFVLALAHSSTVVAFAQQGKTRAEAKAQAYPPLAEDVQREHVTIWSDGTRMAGDIYRSKNLIIDAGKEELMDITKNGGRVAEILKSNGTTVKYHIIQDIGHYGVYGKKLSEALKMELDWFDEHLKDEK